MVINNTRVITPFLPPLFHLAAVKIAVQLFNKFDRALLEKVFLEIQHKNQATSQNRDANYNRANAILLSIPERVREKIMRAFRGLHWAVRSWRQDHSNILRYKKGEFPLYWRPDGSIDTVKVVEQLLLDLDIDIGHKFEIACKYCMCGRLLTLGQEIARSGECVQLADHWMVNFWLWWRRNSLGYSWTEAAAEHLRLPDKVNYVTLAGRLSSFFPLLKPAERQRFLLNVVFSTDDDLRFCLYAMTGEEQSKLLAKNTLAVLLLYLKWPLQNLFLDTAKKLTNFISDRSFDILLFSIYFRIMDRREDFDYCQLFVNFWNQSPLHMQNSARQCEVLSKVIDICLSKIKNRTDANEREN